MTQRARENPAPKRVAAKDTLTPKQAARVLGVAQSTVYWFIRTQQVAAYREVGRRRLYLLKRDVERLKRERAEGPSHIELVGAE